MNMQFLYISDENNFLFSLTCWRIEIFSENGEDMDRYDIAAKLLYRFFYNSNRSGIDKNPTYTVHVKNHRFSTVSVWDICGTIKKYKAWTKIRNRTKSWIHFGNKYWKKIKMRNHQYSRYYTLRPSWIKMVVKFRIEINSQTGSVVNKF